MTAIVSAKLVVGMEIHVELAARTKMFTRAPSPAHAWAGQPEPNTLIDPVVLALPGALPTPNREAIDLAMMVGAALGCELASHTRWDRKSYFYPDLPKSYQISQYDQPLCGPGVFELPADDKDDHESVEPTRIRIRRAHLEEDAGKLLHEWPGGKPIDHSIVDLNRAGTALLEIVTEPDFDSAEQAVRFARALRDICRFLGASEGVLEEGHMRFEPNINTRLTLESGEEVATPIVEIKNLNSFKALAGAIEFEHRAQPERYLQDGRVLESGTKVTRGWSEARRETFVQREKEEAHDYRYFPDPDLPPLEIDEAWRLSVTSRVPELPHARAARYRTSYGLGAKEARALVDDRATNDLFEASVASAVDAGADPAEAGRACANLILQQLFMMANERGDAPSQLGLDGARLGRLAALRLAGDLGPSALEPIMREMLDSEASPEEAARALGLEQVEDEHQLLGWCREVITDAAHAKAVGDVRSGKDAALGRLIGAVMKASGGSASAKRVRELLIELIRQDVGGDPKA